MSYIINRGLLNSTLLWNTTKKENVEVKTDVCDMQEAKLCENQLP